MDPIADSATSDYSQPAPRPTYWLTRFVILRLLGLIYAIAFTVSINQCIPLMGAHGLLPVGDFLQQVTDALGSSGAGFLRLPSLFWIDHSDTALLAAAWIGLTLSCVVLAGYANAPLLAVLWVLYLSFVHVGQEWYGYGWEIQLTETGFLAIFLCPWLDMRPFPRQAPPLPVIILFRWLIFRIMIGAGLIKIRGNQMWRNGTALYHHFETQPMPGPLSRWFHFLPHAWLRVGVWFNHIAELIAPWFAFWPRIARHIAGTVIVLFQVTIILSGNLSFLNWLTIVPAVACFDDGFLSKLMPRPLVRRAAAAEQRSQPSASMRTAAWILTGCVALLSIQPVLNMLSPGQIMNTSFDRLDLVNTYGAFGTVENERLNVVFEGTADDRPDDNAHWQPYLYKGLPVDTARRPPQVAPYHLRLDWAMWFAAMSTPDEYPWTRTLLVKLLQNDAPVTQLFASNPFAGRPPRYVRAVLYKYSFASPGGSGAPWWTRKKLGLWLPPESLPANMP